VDELARVLLDVIGKLLVGLCFGMVAGPSVFSFFLRTGVPEGSVT
jgi:hypothetical protein